MFKNLTSKLIGEVENLVEARGADLVDQAMSRLSGSDAVKKADSPDTPPVVPLKSDLSGNKKAVFIGINYYGSKAELRGCINDVKNVMSFMVEHYGFSPENMRVLTDEPGADTVAPTKANIIDALRWLATDAKPTDSLFLHYSGHGGTKRDTDGDEIDRFDETILPVDFQQVGEILDDELHALVCKPLPEGVRLTAVFDSCHSGSVLDLPWSYKVTGELEVLQIDNRKAAIEAAIRAGLAYAKGQSKDAAEHAMDGVKALMQPGGDETARRKAARDNITHADILMFSGCRDEQTSADASEEGRPTGAASYAMLHCLRENPHMHITELLKGMRSKLEGKYTQIPQMSTAHPVDLNVEFSC